MKNITSLLLLAACALVSNRASAALVAEWEFNSYSGGNATGTANFGSQAGTANFTDGSGANGVSAVGTTANSEDGINSPSDAGAIAATPGSGPNSFTFTISGAGLSGFKMTYETMGTTTTPQQWSYDEPGHGVGLNVFTTVNASSSSSYGLQTIDFSGITALNSGANQDINFILDVGTLPNDAGPGTVDFDNFAITAVPEPVNTALACFGLGIAVVSLGRFHVSRRRRIS